MKTGIKFEYTNNCTCEYYDEETEESIPSPDCWGDCWEYVLDDFKEITKDLFYENETNWWKVSNIRLWDGESSGYFFADNVKELIKGMTVNSEWMMSGEVFNDYINYSLSHHDAPMGSNTTLTIVTEEQREELGLY
jgi:hypothetical protein